MSKFLVTAQAEYYIYVEAKSEDEALEKACDKKNNDNWRRTMNSALANMDAVMVPVHSMEMINK